MLPDQTQRRLLDTKKAAEVVDQSESQLNKLRLTGDGPEFIKLGRSVRYELEALERWITSRRRRSTSDPGESASKAA
jgi:predicted DNA-binding transcriptional regulator AlpA